VTQSSNRPGFGSKTLTETLVAGELFVKHPHGNLALQGDIIAEIRGRMGSTA
jgi:hypothetical protein